MTSMAEVATTELTDIAIRGQYYLTKIMPLAKENVGFYASQLPKGEGPLVKSLYTTLKEKAGHQIAGSAIISGENPFPKESLEVMAGMISATDYVDTVSDTGLHQGVKSRDELLARYVGIFTQDPPPEFLETEFTQDADAQTSISFIGGHMESVRQKLLGLLNVCQLDAEQKIFVLEAMRGEALIYWDGINVMDAKNYSTPQDFLEKVAAKVSNLSILGIVDFVATRGNKITQQDLQQFILATRKFQASHILEDGAVDLEQDKPIVVENRRDGEEETVKVVSEANPNYWLIDNIGDDAGGIERTALVEAENIRRGLSELKQIDPEFAAHWKFVMATKFKYYYDGFSKNKVVSLPLRNYFAIMSQVFA